MKQNILFWLLLFTFSGLPVSAQDRNHNESKRRLIENEEKNTTDSSHGFDHDRRCRDTKIVSPLFLTPVFKPNNLIAPKIEFYHPFSVEEIVGHKPLFQPKDEFKQKRIKHQIENLTFQYLLRNHPSLFHYSIDNMPAEKITLIEKNEKATVDVEKVTVNPGKYEALRKFIPDRKYWISSFESSIKFSENSTSDNWHSGATKRTMLNIFTRNIIKLNYEKDIIKWDNDLEVKLNLYNAPNDTIRRYKVSDDLLRLHSNFGVKAFKKWHYTFDAEFKTQLFKNYKENTTELQAAFLSPYIINLGLGMKYDHSKQYSVPDRSFVVSVNVAPLAYTYMSSIDDEIDRGRHGFPKDEDTGLYKNYLSKFGSTIDFNMTLKPNWNVTWKSRFKYFTAYDRVIAEFENSLDFAISRFFSTLLYLHIRYDDGVTKVNETDSFLQWSQLISFGFNYKW